jgi:hypothetical protein
LNFFYIYFEAQTTPVEFVFLSRFRLLSRSGKCRLTGNALEIYFFLECLLPSLFNTRLLAFCLLFTLAFAFSIFYFSSFNEQTLKGRQKESKKLARLTTASVFSPLFKIETHLFHLNVF